MNAKMLTSIGYILDKIFCPGHNAIPMLNVYEYWYEYEMTVLTSTDCEKKGKIFWLSC